MNRLIVGIAAILLFGVMSTPAQSAIVTGCVSPGGDLKNVAEGEEPTKSCAKNDTEIQWETTQDPTVEGAGGTANSAFGNFFVDSDTGPLTIVSQAVSSPYDFTSLHMVSANVLVLGLGPTERLSCTLTRSDGALTYPNGDTPRIQLFHGGQGVSEVNQSLIGVWQGTTETVTYNLVCSCGNCDVNENEFIQLNGPHMSIIVVPNDFSGP